MQECPSCGSERPDDEPVYECMECGKEGFDCCVYDNYSLCDECQEIEDELEEDEDEEDTDLQDGDGWDGHEDE